MDLFTRTDLRALLNEHQEPSVSLFMPTHRGGAEGDAILFRKLLSQAEERLAAHGLRVSEAKDFLAPAQALLEDVTFWPNQCDGLALFLASQFFRVYRLPWTFTEEVEVGSLFHVVPLLPLLNGDGRFYVLALSQNRVRLLHGTRFTVSPVDLKGVPQNLAEALRAHDKDEPLTFHSRPTSGGSWGAIFEGHGVGIDDAKDDLLRYFQSIDRGLHQVLREEHSPLIMATVDYLMPIYRKANTYPQLLKEGIEGNPDRLSDKDLHDRCWAIIEPHFQETLQRAIGLYHQVAGTGKATDDVKRIVPAAFRGEIETAFVALESHLWGTLDLGTNEVLVHEHRAVGDEDLLNVVAIHTLRHGNTVYALRPPDMPAAGKYLAGIYHLPLPKHSKRA